MMGHSSILFFMLIILIILIFMLECINIDITMSIFTLSLYTVALLVYLEIQDQLASIENHIIFILLFINGLMIFINLIKYIIF